MSRVPPTPPGSTPGGPPGSPRGTPAAGAGRGAMSREDKALLEAEKLRRAGQPAKAFEIVRRLLAGRPNEPRANHMAAVLSALTEDRDRARYYAERAVTLMPANAEARATLGNLLEAAGEHAAAELQLRRATELDGRSLSALTGLARALASLGRHAESEQALLRAMSVAPKHPAAAVQLAAARRDAGRAGDAVDLLRRACQIAPGDPYPVSMLCFTSHNDERLSPADVAGVHAACGRLIEASVRPMPEVRALSAQGRPLRVGLLSSDLRAHAVASFVGPLLSGADRATLHTVCYHLSPESDAVTARLRARATEWRDAARFTELQLAQNIQRDAIDVLIDLHGHTAGGRLRVLAARPAPLVVSAIGYPGTAGLSRIDARLVDSVTDPAGGEALAPERLLRVDPCFLCYEPPADAPPVEPGPMSRGEPLTYGSFNALAKLQPGAVKAWAELLAYSIDARLVLKAKGLERPDVRADVLAQFAAHGVDASRVDLRGATPTFAEHLAAYRDVDIALDTFPYNGTTTTCEAAWMGVPTVTLAGDRHAARVGASLLRAMGLAELVAADARDYVTRAMRLGSDASVLADLRRGMRERLRASPLLDARSYASRVEAALRGLLEERAAAAASGAASTTSGA